MQANRLSPQFEQNFPPFWGAQVARLGAVRAVAGSESAPRRMTSLQAEKDLSDYFDQLDAQVWLKGRGKR